MKKITSHFKKYFFRISILLSLASCAEDNQFYLKAKLQEPTTSNSSTEQNTSENNSSKAVVVPEKKPDCPTFTNTDLKSVEGAIPLSSDSIWKMVNWGGVNNFFNKKSNWISIAPTVNEGTALKLFDTYKTEQLVFVSCLKVPKDSNPEAQIAIDDAGAFQVYKLGNTGAGELLIDKKVLQSQSLSTPLTLQEGIYLAVLVIIDRMDVTAGGTLSVHDKNNGQILLQTEKTEKWKAFLMPKDASVQEQLSTLRLW